MTTQTLRNRGNSTALTGNVTQREDFPEQDAVGPHITLESVDTVEDTLRRHPLDRQASLQKGEPRLQAQFGSCSLVFYFFPH